MAAHDHDCFAEARKTYDKFLKESEHVSYFIYVDGAEKGDEHFYGNTASAGRAMVTLMVNVAEGHEFGNCQYCDAVATALDAAGQAYNLVLSKLVGNKPSC